jgi:uncharacterized protein
MLAFLLALIAAIPLPEKPGRYVTDRAGVLSAQRADALNEKLAQFERTSSDQILVYIDQRLPKDTTIEEMGSEAMRKWGVGQKGKDNGAILFVFVGDRKMRIEVGYGLEGALTDAKSKQIIETMIKPEFKRGDYASGVEQGVSAMLAAIRGEPYQGTGRTVAETGTPQGISRSDRIYAITWSILIVLVFGIPLVFVAIILKRSLQRASPGYGSTFSSSGFSDSSSSSSWSSSSSSSSSSDSSSSSSSDFSGGGGSGGGGGASGSW